MSKVKIEGTVHVVGEAQSFGVKGFRKREVVVEVNSGKFSDYIPVEMTNGLVDTSAGLKVDEHIVVEGFLTGRKWQRDPSAKVQYFLGFKAVTFSVNGQNVVEEPTKVPSYDGGYDETEIPF